MAAIGPVEIPKSRGGLTTIEQFYFHSIEASVNMMVGSNGIDSHVEFSSETGPGLRITVRGKGQLAKVLAQALRMARALDNVPRRKPLHKKTRRRK